MTVTAASIMTRNVVKARPENSVAEVAKLLTDSGISAVPVCDQHGQPVGMISEGDLMRPFGEAHTLQRSWWLNLLAEGTELAPSFVDYLRIDTRRAADLMVSPVITAPDTATLPEIADVLERHKIKRVPVLHEGKMVGIVSRADVLRALSRAPGKLEVPES